MVSGVWGNKNADIMYLFPEPTYHLPRPPTVHSPIATFTVHAALALRQLDKVVTLRVR